MKKSIKIAFFSVIGLIFGFGLVYGQTIPSINPWIYFGGNNAQIRTVSTSTKVSIGTTATSSGYILKVVGGADIDNVSINSLNATSATIGNLQITLIGTSSLIRISTGTAAVPSLAFDTDTDTGLFSPAANMLAFTTGGTSRMRIDNNGNVGIATTTPSQTLTVDGTLNVTATSTFARTVGTRVGIGTLTPNSKLQVVLADAASANVFNMYSTAGGVNLFNLSADASRNPVYYMENGSGVKTINFNTNGVSYMNGGNIGIGTTTHSSKLEVDGTAAITGTSTMAAGTYGGLYVAPSTNVGIGTTTPSMLLDVASATSVFSVSRLNNIYGGASGQQWQSSSTNMNINVPLTIGPVVTSEDTTDYPIVNMPISSALASGTPVTTRIAHDASAVLTVYSESNGLGGVQNLRVGISTTSPAGNLHVVNSSSTATTTLIIGSAYNTTFPGLVCWWNGASFTNEYYPANSITKTVSTSTTCQ